MCYSYYVKCMVTVEMDFAMIVKAVLDTFYASCIVLFLQILAHHNLI